MAIDGDTVVVGAIYANQLVGAAYVFVKPATGWVDMTQTATLKPSDGKNDAQFGHSVSISGNTVAVGAIEEDNGKSGPGAVYVFVKPASGWVDRHQKAKLTSSYHPGGRALGSSVSVSGDTVVAGAPCTYCSFFDQVADVFVRPASGWRNMTQNAILATPARRSGFGVSVSISGNTVVVGANFLKAYSGAACIFVRPTTGWAGLLIPTAQLTNGDQGSLLGSSVFIRGNTIVAGANGSSGYTGAAYVFTKPRNGWKTTSKFNAKLAASDGVAGDEFGYSVSFKFNAKLAASDGVAGDEFGYSVSLNGKAALVGAPFAAINGNSQQGAAYAFGQP